MKTITVEQRPGYTWTPLRNDEVELLKLARSIGIEGLRSYHGALANAALAARAPQPAAPQAESQLISRPMSRYYPSGEVAQWGHFDRSTGRLVRLSAGQPGR